MDMKINILFCSALWRALGVNGRFRVFRCLSFEALIRGAYGRTARSTPGLSPSELKDYTAVSSSFYRPNFTVRFYRGCDRDLLNEEAKIYPVATR
jgi:hypothetical protein